MTNKRIVALCAIVLMTTIKDLYVVTLSEDELVLVWAHGNIDQLLTKEMPEHVEPASLLGIPAY